VQIELTMDFRKDSTSVRTFIIVLREILLALDQSPS
jgi:hypothetical protein